MCVIAGLSPWRADKSLNMVVASCECAPGRKKQESEVVQSGKYGLQKISDALKEGWWLLRKMTPWPPQDIAARGTRC